MTSLFDTGCVFQCAHFYCLCIIEPSRNKYLLIISVCIFFFYPISEGFWPPNEYYKVSNYVLGKAPAVEQTQIETVLDEAVRSTELLFTEDMAKAMNRLHTFKA